MRRMSSTSQRGSEQEIAARRAAFEQSTRELLRSRCDTDILPEEGKVK